MHEVERVRALIAAADGPYAAETVAALQKRLTRLEAQQAPGPAAPSITSAPPALAGATPARHSPPAPKPAGTREKRLRRLAKAMGADERHLASAIAAGTSPDAFALEVVDSRDPEAVARRILKSDGPAASHADANVEAVAARIAKA